MPRAVESDPYLSGRFHVIDSEGFLDVQGSFKSVTTPEVTLTVAEYKEGTQRYKRKFPSNPEVSDIEAMKGVFRRESAIGQWMFDAILGRKYRTDMEILEFHHSDTENLEDFINASASRRLKLFEAFPSRLKAGSDKDSESDDVSLQELTITLEKFEIIEAVD